MSHEIALPGDLEGGRRKSFDSDLISCKPRPTRGYGTDGMSRQTECSKWQQSGQWRTGRVRKALFRPMRNCVVQSLG